MRTSPSLVAEPFPAVGLAELEASRGAAGPDRRASTSSRSTDFAALAERLRGDARACWRSTAGARSATARRTSTPASCAIFRDHVQERRRRYKCRAREYVDSGAVHVRGQAQGRRAGGRSSTAWPTTARSRDELSGPALAFLRECLERWYGRAPDGQLRPALAVAYTRVTFAAPALGERLTCDFDLTFSAPAAPAAGCAEDRVIVESKSARGNAIADRALRGLGARPEGGCSKYCLGVGFTRPDVNSNRCGRCCAATSAPRRSRPSRSRSARRRRRRRRTSRGSTIRAAKAIRDEPKVPARLTVGGRTYRVGIELRGQSSQAFAKRPYAIEADRRVRLLGMPRRARLGPERRPTRIRRCCATCSPTTRRAASGCGEPRRATWSCGSTGAIAGLRADGAARAQPPARAGRRAAGADRGAQARPRRRGVPRPVRGLAVRHVEPDEADKKKAQAARRAVEAFEAALGGRGWRAHLDEAVRGRLRAARRAVQEPGRVPLQHLPAPARGRQAGAGAGVGLRPQRRQRRSCRRSPARGLAAAGPARGRVRCWPTPASGRRSPSAGARCAPTA